MAYKFQVAFVLCLVSSILLFPFAEELYAQACYADPPKGPIVIYEDSFLGDWTTTGSWNVSVTQQATPTYRWGNYALQGQFIQNWAGLELYRNSFDVASRPYLSFRIRKEDAVGMIYVTGHKTDGSIGTWVSLSNYLVPLTTSSFTAGKWYSVRVPFSAMNITSGMPLKGVIFQSATPTTIYLDDVVLTGGLSLGFPLAGTNPWSANISSAFDHTMTKTYLNDMNSVVTAWTGEVGDGIPHPNDSTCRPKTASDQYGSNFFLNGHYTAPSVCGSNSAYLSYDGHPGIDYPVLNGTEIYASEAGTIIQLDCPANGSSCVGQGSGEGRIRILHPNGYTTWYMHLSSRVSTLTLGGTVTKGQLIGYSGQTSAKNIGPHLHFQVTTGSELTSTPIDPYGWDGLYEDPYKPLHAVFNSRQW